MTTYSTISNPINHFKQILASLYPGILVADSLQEVQHIEKFRDKHYQTIFPKTFLNKPDPYYANGIHCYINDDMGNIIATLTFSFESNGVLLPDAKLFEERLSQYKLSGESYVQVGRMLVDPKHRKKGLAKKLFKLMYFGATAMNIDKIVTLYKSSGLSFVENVIGTKTIVADTGENFGSTNSYAAIEWSLRNTKPEFFSWLKTTSSANANKKTEMDRYSDCQFALTTSFQMEVYKHASSLMKGKVLDIGCGSGKAIPWLADNPDVDSYTGYDISASMVEHAQVLLNTLGRSSFKVSLNDINGVTSGEFDSALCICSYQFWSNQPETLHHIASLLKTEAIFVLATPNNFQDLAKLSHEVRKEQPGHPNLESFIAHNMTLEGTATLFSDVDTVLSQARVAGFKLRHYHDAFYLGGMDYFVFIKQA